MINHSLMGQKLTFSICCWTGQTKKQLQRVCFAHVVMCYPGIINKEQ